MNCDCGCNEILRGTQCWLLYFDHGRGATVKRSKLWQSRRW